MTQYDAMVEPDWDIVPGSLCSNCRFLQRTETGMGHCLNTSKDSTLVGSNADNTQQYWCKRNLAFEGAGERRCN